MKNDLEREIEENILILIESGLVIAFLDDEGELKFIHVMHATKSHLKKALPLDNVAYLLKSGEAD